MQQFSRKRAILIGVDKYQHVPQLTYCGHDARDVAKAFRDSLQFKPEDVLEFTLDSVKKPGRGEILHEAGGFLKRGIAPDELLVFYFSGHGMMDQDDKKDYLMPVDASPNDLSGTGISVEHVVKKLSATGCQNIVMFIDACRQEIVDAGAKALGGVEENQFSPTVVEREGLVTFFSCDPKQLSYEIDALGHGSFTYCLLQAIEKGECPTVQLMDKYLRQEVPTINQAHGKRVQRPFTVIKPAEKSELPLFYSELKQLAAARKYDELASKLGDLYAGGLLGLKTFNSAIILIQKAKSLAALSGGDVAKMAIVEALSSDDFAPESFKVAMEAIDRNQIKSSAPEKRL
jgi:uncharacterized caspase-like protein